MCGRYTLTVYERHSTAPLNKARFSKYLDRFQATLSFRIRIRHRDDKLNRGDHVCRQLMFHCPGDHEGAVPVVRLQRSIEPRADVG
jgi:hypothetical protein